eukprot:TRINITY_DN5748_c0_g1_i1.p1 TRINITY_DN5748_c0_g1~~TRINITY_DN5748_c0_g1_i1.p1  ORF type:complete len:1556 (-),score=285.48 TRINITY_DN5748_c0_g1_i1:1621-6288(-)
MWDAIVFWEQELTPLCYWDLPSGADTQSDVPPPTKSTKKRVTALPGELLQRMAASRQLALKSKPASDKASIHLIWFYIYASADAAALGTIDSCIDYLRKAEALCMEIRNQEKRESVQRVLYNNLGCFFMLRGKWHAAIKYFTVVLRLKGEVASKSDLLCRLNLSLAFGRSSTSNTACIHADAAYDDFEVDYQLLSYLVPVPTIAAPELLSVHIQIVLALSRKAPPPDAAALLFLQRALRTANALYAEGHETTAALHRRVKERLQAGSPSKQQIQQQEQAEASRQTQRRLNMTPQQPSTPATPAPQHSLWTPRGVESVTSLIDKLELAELDLPTGDDGLPLLRLRRPTDPAIVVRKVSPPRTPQQLIIDPVPTNIRPRSSSFMTQEHIDSVAAQEAAATANQTGVPHSRSQQSFPHSPSLTSLDSARRAAELVAASLPVRATPAAAQALQITPPRNETRATSPLHHSPRQRAYTSPHGFVDDETSPMGRRLLRQQTAPNGLSLQVSPRSDIVARQSLTAPQSPLSPTGHRSFANEFLHPLMSPPPPRFPRPTPSSPAIPRSRSNSSGLSGLPPGHAETSPAPQDAAPLSPNSNQLDRSRSSSGTIYPEGFTRPRSGSFSSHSSANSAQSAAEVVTRERRNELLRAMAQRHQERGSKNRSLSESAIFPLQRRGSLPVELMRQAAQGYEIPRAWGNSVSKRTSVTDEPVGSVSQPWTRSNSSSTTDGSYVPVAGYEYIDPQLHDSRRSSDSSRERVAFSSPDTLRSHEHEPAPSRPNPIELPSATQDVVVREQSHTPEPLHLITPTNAMTLIETEPVTPMTPMSPLTEVFDAALAKHETTASKATPDAIVVAAPDTITVATPATIAVGAPDTIAVAPTVQAAAPRQPSPEVSVEPPAPSPAPVVRPAAVFVADGPPSLNLEPPTPVSPLLPTPPRSPVPPLLISTLAVPDKEHYHYSITQLAADSISHHGQDGDEPRDARRRSSTMTALDQLGKLDRSQAHHRTSVEKMEKQLLARRTLSARASTATGTIPDPTLLHSSRSSLITISPPSSHGGSRMASVRSMQSYDRVMPPEQVEPPKRGESVPVLRFTPRDRPPETPVESLVEIAPVGRPSTNPIPHELQVVMEKARDSADQEAFPLTTVLPWSNMRRHHSVLSLASRGSSDDYPQPGECLVWGSNTFHQISQLDDQMILTPLLLRLESPIAQVACGEEFTLFLTTTGRVFACGRNDDGQLGVGDCFARNAPVLSRMPSIITQISAGAEFGAALTAASRVYTWGREQDGRLGRNTGTVAAALPGLVDLSPKIRMVACGESHVIVCTVEGTMWSWGVGAKGRLGIDSEDNRLFPTPVKQLDTKIFVFVAAGAEHSVALTDTGVMVTWGSNEFGQLGQAYSSSAMNRMSLSGSAFAAQQSRSRPLIPVPTMVNLFGRDKVIHCSCGWGHTAAITASGKLFTFGLARYGQLGLGDENDKFMPTQVVNLWRQQLDSCLVSCGAAHTIALTGSGQMLSAGWGQSGRLGNGEMDSSVHFKHIMVPGDTAIQMVASGGAHSVAIVGYGPVTRP